MPTTYRVIATHGKDGSAIYTSVQESTDPGTPPFLACDHHHATRAEASKCREFRHNLPTKRLRRPRDPIQLAKLIGDIATGQVRDEAQDGRNPLAVARGSKG